MKTISTLLLLLLLAYPLQAQTVIANPDMNVALVNSSVFGNVLTNDLPSTNDTAHVYLLRQAAHGYSVLNLDGTYSYFPNENYCGKDAFRYQVCIGNKCDTATVNITIVCDIITDELYAQTDYFLIDTASFFSASNILLSNDIDPEQLQVTNASLYKPFQQGNGTLSPSGQLDYTSSGYIGYDTLQYVAMSGTTANITNAVVRTIPNFTKGFAGDDAFVLFQNDTLCAKVTLNDIGIPSNYQYNRYLYAYHGEINMNTDGTFCYIPDAGYIGSDHFYYKIGAGANAVWATAYILVLSPTFCEPVSRKDSLCIVPNGSGSVLLQLNDVTCGNSMYQIHIAPAHGAANITPNGLLYYSTNQYLANHDRVTYEVCNTAHCDTASLYITISPACATIPIPLYLQENSAENVLLYPTIATTTLHLESKNNALQNVEIRDIQGNTIKKYTYTIATNTTTITVDDLASGMYYLVAQIANRIVSRKFIKE